MSVLFRSLTIIIGARCIEPLLLSNGCTGLLVAAAEGIHYLTPSGCVSKTKSGTLVFSDTIFKGIRQLYVAQDREDVTIWFRNIQDELGYSRTKTSGLAEKAISTMLLPAGRSSSFAPVVTGPSEVTGSLVRQMLIVNDRDGNLTLLEQSSDLGLWRKTPFFAASPSEPTELKSYTVTVKPFDQQGSPLIMGSILLSASLALSVIINGQNKLLTNVSSWYDCGADGTIDFIIPSDTLGAQAFKIDGLRSKEGELLTFTTAVYDPSTKPMARLAEKINARNSVDEFKTLKTVSGEDLLDKEIKSDAETMKGAYQGLQSVVRAYNTSSNSVSSSQSVATQSSHISSKAAKMAGRGVADAIGGFFMDAWNWVKEKIQEATDSWSNKPVNMTI